MQRVAVNNATHRGKRHVDFQQLTHGISNSRLTAVQLPAKPSQTTYAPTPDCRSRRVLQQKKHFQPADATIANCQRNSLELPTQRFSNCRCNDYQSADATDFTERKSVQLIGEQRKRPTHAFAPRPTEDTFHLTSQYCPHSNFQPREMTTKPPIPYIYTRAPANGDRYKDKDIAKALPKKCCGRTSAINFN